MLTTMAERVRLWFATMLNMVQRVVARGEGWRALIVAGALLIPLAPVTPPWPAAAETASAPLSTAPEHTTEFPRHGIVTKMSNLRASPGMQGAIVGIASEGTSVEILTENDQWYWVRSEAGVEAWIYRSLVRIEPVPLQVPASTPTVSAPVDFTKIPPTPAAKSDAAADSRSGIIRVERESDNLPLIAFEESTRPSEATKSGWVIDAILPYMQGLSGYVIIGLVMVLGLSIGLQLRATRQLRRVMQEMGQVFDIVDEIAAAGTFPRLGNSGAPTPPRLPEAPTNQPQHPMIALTAVERAVLDAISNQRDVHEGELGKILENKGFAGVLIKAVIGDIVRKTGSIGLPWVDVRYVQGRYRYRLRPDAVSSLDV